ncbi:hypothetical protein DICVIV_09971 [Dictyocaulus viviparus]|uniref:Myosin motor domain-containing protein n=1 Tax=Dictyocaulus viviparus TaxID=29172 RepID=A0A0D8XH69_DICVI|nr:hypothetical protein DICVIV_09971 [Dictyocaulus viviparus]
MIHRGSSPGQFVLEHAMSCFPTLYDVSGWVKQARPCESEAAGRSVLLASKSRSIVNMFGTLLSNNECKLRRATQIAHLDFNIRKSISGFCSNINKHVVRSRYPEWVSFRDFRRRFGCLVEELNSSIDNALDDRVAASKILERVDIHQNRYCFGISQRPKSALTTVRNWQLSSLGWPPRSYCVTIHLAADVMSELEDRREQSLSSLVMAFQQVCRRYLATKWLHRRRVLETAIKCIQRNGIIHIRIRDWTWWKLYMKVMPLLARSRSDQSHQECEIRIRQLEQQLHRLRVEKTEQEGEIYELKQRLGNEVHAANELTQALERETQMRVELNIILQQYKDRDEKIPYRRIMESYWSLYTPGLIDFSI